MNRACRLPANLVRLCEFGCIYREKAFKHLQCPYAPTSEPCAAPCKLDCSCDPKNGQVLVLPLDKKNEVFLL